MHYVISDLHGCKQSFQKLLAKLKLQPEDHLYILGDTMDKGPSPASLLLRLAARPNTTIFLGNHDEMAYNNLSLLEAYGSQDDLEKNGKKKELEAFRRWLKEGGQPGLADYLALSADQRQEVLRILRTAILYARLKVGDQAYVLVHAGLDNFSPQRPLWDYDKKEMIYHSPDFSKVYFEDAVLVTGHRPMYKFPNPDDIYRREGHLSIDGGCVFGHRLYALCLEDQSVTYVEASHE